MSREGIFLRKDVLLFGVIAMSEEATIAAVQTLYERLRILQHISIKEIILPETYDLFRKTLDDAYDALVHLEDTLNGLGQKLEYQHWRLGGAVEELKPLMI